MLFSIAKMINTESDAMLFVYNLQFNSKILHFKVILYSVYCHQ